KNSETNTQHQTSFSSYHSSISNLLFFEASTARKSQRSFIGWLLCPFIHRNLTWCLRYIFRNRFHKSGFFFPANPFFSQPTTQPLSTESTAPMESDTTRTERFSSVHH